MGEASKRRSFSAREREKQPFCVYCGGDELAVDVDHVPPKALFDNKHRPKDPVVSTCKSCHESTREIDGIVAWISRFAPNPETEIQRQDVHKYMRTIINRHPSLIIEMNGTSVADGNSGAFIGNGPILSSVMKNFAARLGYAFDNITRNRIISEDGAVFVRWYSNSDALNGKLPSELFNILGTEQPLKQGAGFTTENQFYYSHVMDGPRSAFWFTFRESFAILAIVAPELGEFPEKAINSEHLVRPKFLRGLRIPS